MSLLLLFQPQSGFRSAIWWWLRGVLTAGAEAVGSAVGTGTADAVGTGIVAAVRSAAGISTADAIGEATDASAGSFDRIGSASAIGASTAAAAGSPDGIGDAPAIAEAAPIPWLEPLLAAVAAPIGDGGAFCSVNHQF